MDPNGVWKARKGGSVNLPEQKACDVNMKLRIERTKDRVEGAKRQSAPLCDALDVPRLWFRERDGPRRQLLLQPDLRRAREVLATCRKCDNEGRSYEKGEIELVLDLALMLPGQVLAVVPRDEALIAIGTLRQQAVVFSDVDNTAAAEACRKIAECLHKATHR